MAYTTTTSGKVLYLCLMKVRANSQQNKGRQTVVFRTNDGAFMDNGLGREADAFVGVFARKKCIASVWLMKR